MIRKPMSSVRIRMSPREQAPGDALMPLSTTALRHGTWSSYSPSPTNGTTFDGSASATNGMRSPSILDFRGNYFDEDTGTFFY
jgi:hypothetical protein